MIHDLRGTGYKVNAPNTWIDTHIIAEIGDVFFCGKEHGYYVVIHRGVSDSYHVVPVPSACDSRTCGYYTNGNMALFKANGELAHEVKEIIGKIKDKYILLLHSRHEVGDVIDAVDKLTVRLIERMGCRDYGIACYLAEKVEEIDITDSKVFWLSVNVGLPIGTRIKCGEVMFTVTSEGVAKLCK